MTRKEKRNAIIEIMKKWKAKGYLDFPDIADEILALPLDVPSEEEIDNIYEVDDYDKYRKEGAKWMREEIKKRNK